MRVGGVAACFEAVPGVRVLSGVVFWGEDGDVGVGLG